MKYIFNIYKIDWGFMAQQIILSEFGDPNVNGVYNQDGTHDGYPFYKNNDNDYIIIYKLQNGPYSFSPGYWVEKVSSAFKAVLISTPKYTSMDIDLFTATWSSVSDITSGESSIGTVGMTR